MDLEYILWMYFIVLIVLILILAKSGFFIPEVFMFSLIVSTFLLILVKPPNEVNINDCNLSSIFIYYAIILISTIAIFIYSGIKSYYGMKYKKLKV